MRRLRPLAFVLTLLVSPLGSAVCEIACGTPVHAAGHGAEPAQHAGRDAHDHHAHHAPPTAASVAPVSVADGPDGVIQAPGPECDPLFGFPARVRATFSGPDLHVGIMSPVIPSADATAPWHRRLLPPDPGPPDPPRHAPVPLRI